MFLKALLARLSAHPPAFRALLLSDAAMMLAMLIGQVAVPWWISGHGGAVDLAIYGTAMAAVMLVSLPLLSPLGDRWPKSRLISGGLAIYSLANLALAIFASFNFYDLWLVIILRALCVVAMSLITPVSLSIAAELVPPERLSDALGLQKSSQAIGRLAGPALAGLAIAVASTAFALWLHMFFLLIAALAAWRIAMPPKAPRTASQEGWWPAMRAGFLAKWRIPMERHWTATMFVMMLFFLPALGMLVPLRVREMGLSGAWMGACEVAISLGLLVGAAGGADWVARRVGRFRASFGAMMLEGVAQILVGVTPSPYLLVFGFFIVGVALSVVQLVGQTHRMLAIPPDYRARMTAVNLMVMQLAGTFGPMLAGWGLLHGSAGQVYLAFGIAYSVAGLGFLRVPGYRDFLSLSHEAVKNWYGRKHPELFDGEKKPG